MADNTILGRFKLSGSCMASLSLLKAPAHLRRLGKDFDQQMWLVPIILIRKGLSQGDLLEHLTDATVGCLRRLKIGHAIYAFSCYLQISHL